MYDAFDYAVGNDLSATLYRFGSANGDVEDMCVPVTLRAIGWPEVRSWGNRIAINPTRTLTCQRIAPPDEDKARTRAVIHTDQLIEFALAESIEELRAKGLTVVETARLVLPLFGARRPTSRQRRRVCHPAPLRWFWSVRSTLYVEMHHTLKVCAPLDVVHW